MSDIIYTPDTLSSHDVEENDVAKHQVPELSKPDVNPVLTAARILFEEKVHKYLDVDLPEKEKKLLKKDPLTKLYAFYEEHAMKPDKIPFINLKIDRGDELKALMYSKDFEAIGDLIMDDFKGIVDKYLREIEHWSTLHSSLEEDESGGGGHGVLLPVSTGGEDEDGEVEGEGEDEEDEEGYQGGGVPLIYRTSPSQGSDFGLVPIDEEEEEEEDNSPVFL